jgi:hypothetical protein
MVDARALRGAHFAGFQGHFQAAAGKPGGARRRSPTDRHSTCFANYFKTFTSFGGHRMAQMSPALAALMRACPCS